jgi:lysophospholipid acyltransferase (LPLAT)-like uncharacterized protein
MASRWRVLRDARLVQRWGPSLAAWILRAVAATLRREDVGLEHPRGVLQRGERAIVAFWHGRLLMMPFVYPGEPTAILISQHRDGEVIARVAERLGLSVVRGSATRGAARAFREMLQLLRSGRHAVITPDGPRGPRQRVKPGVVELARLSGMPILPVAFGAWPRKTLQSWDRFLVPLPFGRGVYVWGAPIYVPADADREALRRFQQAVQDRLDAVVASADARAARSPQAALPGTGEG